MQFDQLKRRAFLTLLGGVTAWPLRARAQQPTPVIGFLSPGPRHSDSLRLAAFWRGLNEAGYVEGTNVASEYRWADDKSDQLPRLAAALAVRQPAVIVALGGPTSATAAKAATTTIPILFVVSGDPVKLGLVASLNRPGGNATGRATLGAIVVAKQFEALHETVPKATIIGCLVNRMNPHAEIDTKEAQNASRTLGLQLLVLSASTEPEIETAFATFVQQRTDAVVVVADALFNSRPKQIVALAAHHALPTIYPFREFAAAGGLMSYGTSIADPYHQVGVYAGRILKGERPENLPVVQETKIELIINLKAAKTLGITFPIALLGRADDVIE